MKRILYIQYTTPAAYPPLMHSSRILADLGWQVRLLAAPIAGVDHFVFPSHPNIAVQWAPLQPKGVRQKLHYLQFLSKVRASTSQFRPDWAYVSDLFAAPSGNQLRKKGIPVLYHEHDAPRPPRGRIQGWLAGQRLQLLRQAELVVVPNAGRREQILKESRRTGPTLVVWNCPSLRSVPPSLSPKASVTPFHLYYHGTLVPERIPLALIDVLRARPDSELTLVGYVPQGAKAYQTEMQERAKMLGVESRLHWLGSLSHDRLATAAPQANVGLALVPLQSDDFNLTHMAGASNKMFEYLGRGLWALASDTDDWRNAFGELATYVDPNDAGSILQALDQLALDPQLADQRRLAGHQAIRTNWNYEVQFEPVLNHLQSSQQKATG